MFEQKTPLLIRLTMIACPEFGRGQPTAAYINPLAITMIARGMGSFNKSEVPNEPHPRVECSIVALHTGQQIMVVETPEIIASLHERALRETTDN